MSSSAGGAEPAGRRDPALTLSPPLPRPPAGASTHPPSALGMVCPGRFMQWDRAHFVQLASLFNHVLEAQCSGRLRICPAVSQRLAARPALLESAQEARLWSCAVLRSSRNHCGFGGLSSCPGVLPTLCLSSSHSAGSVFVPGCLASRAAVTSHHRQGA